MYVNLTVESNQTRRAHRLGLMELVCLDHLVEKLKETPANVEVVRFVEHAASCDRVFAVLFMASNHSMVDECIK